MKKHFFILSAVAVMCTAFITPTEDYRDVYVGTYFCRSKCGSLSSDYTELTYNYDTVTVIITKNSRDSILNINIRGKIHELKLKNGFISTSSKSNQKSGEFFSNDSILFSISPNRIPTGCSFRGKKQ